MKNLLRRGHIKKRHKEREAERNKGDDVLNVSQTKITELGSPSCTIQQKLRV
jgi:hypothetical protein